MKALSIHPVYACEILAGQKTVEVRTWKTAYRGDLLICSTNHKVKDTIPGHALCVVTLKDIEPLSSKHFAGAMFKRSNIDNLEGKYAWILSDVRWIKPIPLKGKLGLWNYEGEIEYLKDPENDEEDERMYKELYEPIFV